MFPPRLRLPLSNLTAFAVGAGLAAACFLARETTNPDGAMNAGTSGKPPIAAATVSGTTRNEKPWKTKSGREAPPAGAEHVPEERPGDSEQILRGLRAQFRHEARSEALKLTYRLGLDPAQADEFMDVMFAEADLRLASVSAKNGETRLSHPELAGRSRTWLALQLNSEQEGAYTRYRQSRRREEAERYALTETNEIARVMDLTEEQRAALIQKFADTHVSIDEFAEFIHYGEPIDVKSTAANGIPTNVVITESRIAPIGEPIAPHDLILAETLPSDPLAEILTQAQLATYREFQAKQRELERLMEEEMRATKEE